MFSIGFVIMLWRSEFTIKITDCHMFYSRREGWSELGRNECDDYESVEYYLLDHFRVFRSLDGLLVWPPHDGFENEEKLLTSQLSVELSWSIKGYMQQENIFVSMLYIYNIDMNIWAINIYIEHVGTVL